MSLRSGTARAPAIEDASEPTLEAWATLSANRDGTSVQLLADFLNDVNQHPTSVADRNAILDQAHLLLDHLYPHLPFKKQFYATANRTIDPARDLELIRGQVETLREIDFQECMLMAFATVRDLHTTYTMPPLFQGKVAFLPFRVRFFLDDSGQRHYLVTSVMKTSSRASFGDFQPGVEITRWDDNEIGPMVQFAAALQPGANDEAVALRGAQRLTVRAIATSGVVGYGSPPFQLDTEAVVTWLPLDGSPARRSRFPWSVASFPTLTSDLPNDAFSMAQDLSDTRFAARALYGGESQRWGAPPRPNLYGVASDPAPAHDAPPAAIPDDQQSRFPDVFELQFSDGVPGTNLVNPAHLSCDAKPAAKFGYIRISKFVSATAAKPSTQLPDEFNRILTLMDQRAPDGLILDIRSNPGGDIVAAERMLQMLTPGEIRTSHFHLANTEAVHSVLDQISPTDPNLGLWKNALPGAPLPAGEPVTAGQPLTAGALANDTGQVYQGPVVLITDALTYSAADMFSAGFQDNKVGTIIGLDSATGGGGASVWSHGHIFNVFSALPNSGMSLQPLPGGARMTLAILRATRSNQAEQPIEDLGVARDVEYRRTLRDLADYNCDMLQFACGVLATQPVFRVDLAADPAPGDPVTLQLTNSGLVRLDFLLNFDTKPALSVAVLPGQPATVQIPTCGAALRQITIRGFATPDAAQPSAVRVVSLESHVAAAPIHKKH